MKGNDLYQRLLGLEHPWRVEDVAMDVENKVVEGLSKRMPSIWKPKPKPRLVRNSLSRRRFVFFRNLPKTTTAFC